MKSKFAWACGVAGGIVALPALVLSSDLGVGPPLGLARLADRPAVMSVFSPSETSGPALQRGKLSKRNGVGFVDLEAKEEFSWPLRGEGKEVLFVSFSLYASRGTVITIGGATLGLILSDVDERGQLMVLNGKGEWEGLGLHAVLDKFEDRELAILPVITARIDRAAGIFDVYIGPRMLADGLPLAEGVSPGIIITSGTDGAWLNGIVQSDENPFYEDVNRNGIDDQFEGEKRIDLGIPMVADQRRQLIAQWRMHQIRHRPDTLHVNLPRPDRLHSESDK